MADREMFLEGSGVIMKEENAAALVMRTVEPEFDKWANYEIKRGQGGLVTADINTGFIYLKKKAENQCEFKMVFDIDNHIDFIPQRLIDYSMKKIIGVFNSMIASRSEKLDKCYTKLWEEKKEFYDKVRSAVEEIGKAPE